MDTKWIFIIDTDSYAGNFERDMCAYVTGCIGDCEAGKKFAEMYRKETKDGDEYENQFSEYIEQRTDEHGCARPTECWPTKGWLSVGYDNAVLAKDWNQAKADAAFQKANADIYRGYLSQVQKAKVGEAGWTQKGKDREIARRQKDIDAALKATAIKYEPNNSVAIFFEKKPTPEMITLMKERAAEFSAAKRKIAEQEDYLWEKNFKLTIHGFRLVKETTNFEEEIDV